MLQDVDADGDGKLDYGEIASALQDEETTEYLQELGLKDAMALMERLDKDGDGNVDVMERREFIKSLVPRLKEEVYRMRETGEYTASGQLWNTRKEFMQSLADDHKREVTSLQKIFASEYDEKVRDPELGFFQRRVSEIRDALVAHWEVQERYLEERVIRQKIDLFMATKKTTRNPTDPLTPKYTRETFEIKAYLKNLSQARHPTEFQLREGERMKVRLHKLEDEAVAKFATYQPAWFKLKAQELKKEIATLRQKFKQLRRLSFERHEKYVGLARGQLFRRHRAYDQRLEHAHAVGLHEKVLEDLRPVRPLNEQPRVDSYKPTMQRLNKGGGNLDRVANGLGGYHLRELERTGGAPEHILRSSASGPPVRLKYRADGRPAAKSFASERARG
jgi:hypothetical protein